MHPTGFGDRDRERWRLVASARSVAGVILAQDEDAIPLTRTFVVGDTVHDVSATRRAGAVAIAVASGSQSYDTLAGAHPDLLLRDLAQGITALIAEVCGSA
jgi:phosphoglycolate phosphatase-like HAD superfamily hydrolase